MSCRPSWKTEKYRALVIKLRAQLEAVNTAILGGLVNGEYAEYRFDSGEGSQKTEYRKLDELWDMQRKLESALDRAERILQGKGLKALNLRRKNNVGRSCS